MRQATITRMRRSHLCLTLSLLLALTASFARAQRNEATLSDAEVEQLRDSAYVANDRVIVFIKLIDTRINSLRDLYAKPRRPGREQDTHDLIEQFTSLSDELSDNLDDYSSRHRDIRKALPKLIDAIERWGTAIKSPPDNETYNVSRKIALESLRDLREQANEMIADQKTWFAAHPPPKEDNSRGDFEHPR
ncbi:hypothetical protein [Edaphobacter albus]|uniref:hypothetical protein n=1 Tax=Edaphobacter sp. 4G125 TaxID=2763071 RepID=UPI00210543C3|nr:hypothetical protein [Edaphobacter sp. 4G125]